MVCVHLTLEDVEGQNFPPLGEAHSCLTELSPEGLGWCKKRGLVTHGSVGNLSSKPRILKPQGLS